MNGIVDDFAYGLSSRLLLAGVYFKIQIELKENKIQRKTIRGETLNRGE